MMNPFSLMEDPERRFDRFERLVGSEGLKKIRSSHVMIIGVGGVGSWAAEAVTRSAVGKVTVVDFDTVCIRNFNRQLQATSGMIGKPKALVLAERLRLVNPEATIVGVDKYFNHETADELMKDRPDFVIDAIDHVTSKCFLIDYCRRNQIPLIVSTGSGGRLDPTKAKVCDLGRTKYDPLAKEVREILRKQYAFPETGDYGVLAVYSEEAVIKPHAGTESTDCKSGCLCPQGENEFQSCTKKSIVHGTASFVTAAFGMICASESIKALLYSERNS